MAFQSAPFNLSFKNENIVSIDNHQISENQSVQAKIKEYQNKYLEYNQFLFSNLSMIYLKRISMKG